MRVARKTLEAAVIIDLPSTTTTQVNTSLVELRETGGAIALGRVLTLVITAADSDPVEEAIEAANDASREHPARVIVLVKGAKNAAARLDAQIRIGGDAGASEVVVLRLYGQLASQGPSVVVPLLLPDAPIVAWWPFAGPSSPATDPLGRLAQRRITDSASGTNPVRALRTRARSYVAGDTDLAWTRLTHWRAQLVSALDLPPYEDVVSASVTGEGDSPSTELLAGWLAEYLNVPVKRVRTTEAQGIVSVSLQRRSGDVVLHRPDGQTGTLTQPEQPTRYVGLRRRQNRDCLGEELRRLDPDEVYQGALRGLNRLSARTGKNAAASERKTRGGSGSTRSGGSAGKRTSGKAKS